MKTKHDNLLGHFVEKNGRKIRLLKPLFHFTGNKVIFKLVVLAIKSSNQKSVV
jgi:hypothetical protein